MKRHIDKRYLWWLLGLILLHSAVLTPLYLIFGSNVVYTKTVIPDILYTLSEWTGYFFHWLFLAFYLKRREKGYIGITLIGWGVHYVSLYAVNLGIMGFASLALTDILELVAQYLLDLLLLFVAILLSRLEKAKIQKWLALLPVSLFRILSRILYDVFFGSDVTQWAVMLVYYLWDVVLYITGVFVVSYFASKKTEYVSREEIATEIDVIQ